MGKIGTLLAAAVLLTALPGCTSDRGDERWATTNNTNVKIDWDKVNEAYKNAEGPQEFETKVNEIYEGDELISISVQDVEGGDQEVVGFFDTNSDGKVDEPEKVFTIKREIKEDGKGQYHIAGHGPHYGYYRSPFWDIASGMMLGAWISSAFRPGYVATTYVTSPARSSQLRTQRSAYRAKNPSRFSRRTSGKSGRTYGTRSRGSSGRRSGGGGFGVRGRKRDKKPVRLTA